MEKEMESLLDHQDWKQVVIGQKKSKTKSPKTTKKKKILRIENFLK